MERCKNKTFGADPFFMHADRNTASIVFNCGGAIGLKGDIYRIAVSGQVLVYRIIYNLIDQMVQALCRDTADIHTGPDSDSLQTF